MKSLGNGPRPAVNRHIALMIGSMNYGGAETQATVLANGLAQTGRKVSLFVSYSPGPLCERLIEGVRLRCLGRRSRWDLIQLLRRLSRTLQEDKPDVLYAFMPGANLAASIAKLRFPKLKVAWGVRASSLDFGHYGWNASFASWLERRLSRWPNLIIANSVAGHRDAIARGFPDSDNFIVIPNGIDVNSFKPDFRLREKVRQEWQILPHEVLLGIVARLDPMKDHQNFLEAAAKIKRRIPNVRFVSIGGDSAGIGERLHTQAAVLGLQNSMIWAGPRNDLPAVHNALDLLVSSSIFGEGFSNVLGEAMACGVPCIATNVGDAGEILRGVGLVVPVREPQALADAAISMLERKRSEGSALTTALRQRIVENYSVEMLVARTSTALERILQ